MSGTVLRAENMAVNSKILPPLILRPSTGDVSVGL